MKICSIRIKGYQQFDDLYLDFTNPETGEPVDKVCFIGRNGTGKSTLLRLINECLAYNINEDEDIIFDRNKVPIIAVKLKIGDSYIIYYQNHLLMLKTFINESIEKIDDWFNKLNSQIKNIRTGIEDVEYHKFFLSKNICQQTGLKSTGKELFIFSPSESYKNESVKINDVPVTDLNRALPLLKNISFYHLVQDEFINDFWTILIYLVKRRENEREEFENKPDNLNKTKKQLIKEFDSQNPKILKKLADLWNKILDKAGLEFDYESASNPIQLNDNLKAYIRLKSTGEKINYNQLSTGIRNFIFRIGHIYSLYFNREIKKGFLLVDEPENSLFPDFLYDLIDIYKEITTDKNGERNTQMFFATHNPIIAAQFEPYERILLEWDEKGHVQASKGKAPVGDDPNDLLRQDFHLDHLMGRKGQEMWERYLNLKKELRHAKNGKDKDELISEISKIGQKYNFEQ